MTSHDAPDMIESRPDAGDAPEMAGRLVMRGVEKRFGATQALGGVDLAVAAGEIHALVGENGAGKSTLMKVLAGAHRPDAGHMWLDGQPYAPASPMQARRAGVAMIYQELSLAPHLSVGENILLGIEPAWGPLVRRRAARQMARQALAEVGLAHVPPDMPVRRLAPAHQQLVEIARAMAMRCRVIALDEPTSSLSGREIERLFSLVRRLRDRGVAIVYISHALEEVAALCDRFTVLRDGRTVGGGAVAGTPREAIIALMVGRDLGALYPRSGRAAGDVILELDGVAGRATPRSASLELRRGEVLGIAGLVGAGRTELLRAIFGLDPVRRGRIRVGRFTGAASPARRWAQGAGFVCEDRKREGLALNLSIADNLTLPRLRGLGPRRLVLPSRQRSASRPWIGKLSIRCRSPADRISTLSGGNQQKVALARLLHAQVDLLLLDEPTRGIDVGSKAQIYRLIEELARGDAAAGIAPRAVLIVSSYLPELLGLCDRIAVMSRGRLGEARPAAEWDEHRLLSAAIGDRE